MPKNKLIRMMNRFGGYFLAEPEKVDYYKSIGGRVLPDLEPEKEDKKKATTTQDLTSPKQGKTAEKTSN